MGGAANNPFLKGLGTTANVFGGLMSLRGGGFQNYMINRARALQDPAVRAALEQSPFLQGVLGVGAIENPELAGFELPANITGQEITGYRGVAAPTGRTTRTLDLPPLDPVTEVKQLRARAARQLYYGEPDALETATRVREGIPIRGMSVADYPEGTPIPRSPGETVRFDQYGRMVRTIGDEPAPIQVPYGANAPVDASGRIAGRQFIGLPPQEKQYEVGAIVQDPRTGRVYRATKQGLVEVGFPGTAPEPAAAPPPPAPVPGPVGPTGPTGPTPSSSPGFAVPPDLPGIAVTKPSATSARASEQMSRILGAKSFGALYGSPAVDLKSKQPHLKKSDGTPYTALDAFTPQGALGAAKNVVGNLPGGQVITQIPSRARVGLEGGDRGLRAAINKARTLQANVVTYIKAFGDTGNVAVSEQAITGANLIPNVDSDTREIAEDKLQTLDEMLNAIAQAIGAGASGADLIPIFNQYGIEATVKGAGGESGAGGVMEPSPTTPQPRTLQPGTISLDDFLNEP